MWEVDLLQSRRARATVGACLVLAVVVAPGLAAADTMVAPPNPPANIAPVPNIYVGGCTEGIGGATCSNPCVSPDVTWLAYDNSQACTNYVLSAINNARATISEPAIVLPSNWYQL